jgi:hypothetical protein
VTYGLSPVPVHGRDAFTSMISASQHTFPDLQIEMKQLVAEGELVTLRWMMRGSLDPFHAAPMWLCIWYRSVSVPHERFRPDLRVGDRTSAHQQEDMIA